MMKLKHPPLQTDYYIDTPNPKLDESVKQASISNGEEHSELVGLVQTTHGQVKSLGIWNKSFGMADDREDILF